MSEGLFNVQIPMTCDCGHQFKVSFIGMEQGDDVTCPECGHAEEIDDDAFFELEERFRESVEALYEQLGLDEPDDDTIEFIRMNNRIPASRASHGRAEVPENFGTGAGPGHFFAIDVETANAALCSICQIGVVEFCDGKEVSAASWLIDPECWFDDVNVTIHGITPEMVRGAPKFGDVAELLRAKIGTGVVVCHTHFDRVALRQACDSCRLPAMPFTWLDSAKVARRTWEQFAQSGYGLAPVASHLGITFRHHDALEDARAAGLILLRAIEHSGRSVPDWLNQIEHPITTVEPIRREGHDDGVLSGERIVFTGALEIARRSAADMASSLGAAVDSGVTKKTTMLVVGDQDVEKLNGKDKSAKHRKAEELIAVGQSIRILRESDWKALHRGAITA